MSDLIHYGTPRKSGRYPWGSGGELLEISDRLFKDGLTEKEVAAGLGIKTTELRNRRAIASAAKKESIRLHIIRQKESGMSVAAISSETKIPESTIRDLLKPNANAKFHQIQNIATALRKLIRREKFVDVGVGSELYMGVSRTKLNNAITLLEDEGYQIGKLRQEQLGSRDKKTTVKVLIGPESTWDDLISNKANIAIPNYPFTLDKGSTFLSPDPVKNVSSKKVLVKYIDDGGGDKDGLIELRRGVPELNLGAKKYAQVRIGVDGTHFLKGMAVIRDDLPDGVDIVYNTSKDRTNNPFDAMKLQQETGASVFGAVVRPNTFEKNGRPEIGAVNILNEEGDWALHRKALSSQVLSKQAPSLAAKQLKIISDNGRAELDDIMQLSNPTVKNHLLMEFADKADRAAVDMQAAALPRQSTHVLLPDPKIKPNEIYAPNFNNGETVALVRYPHGGIFEIPELKVNNKYSGYRKLIGATAPDAVAIHPDVAKKLSGADFDGDTVLVVPNRNKTLKTAPSLTGLKDFDPIRAYPKADGMKVMSEKQKQRQMGDVSNLITDMTIKGANQDEIARAVRHSMVVIDAVKHELNYSESYRVNSIAALKRTYQGSARAGASTLISKAKSEYRVPQRHERYSINPKTGEKIWTNTEKVYTNSKTGKEVFRETVSKKMAESKDGYTLDGKPLSSGTVVERVYADHANRMKRLGNEARLASLQTKAVPYSASARKTFQAEVDSLDRKYKAAVMNRPVQRKAQLLGGEIYKAKLNANPEMSRAEKRKEKGRSLVQAQARLEASKPTIKITPQEWSAIELGAVSPTRLGQILLNADMDVVRSYATPRATRSGLSTGKVTRAKSLIKSGYTAAEIASALGVPVSQIRDIEKD